MNFYAPPQNLSNENDEDRRSSNERREGASGVATATAITMSMEQMETEDVVARRNRTIAGHSGGEEADDCKNEDELVQGETIANKERRASIQLILKDPNLTNEQRRHSIQILMDSRRRSSFGASFIEAARNVTAEFALRSGNSSNSCSDSSTDNRSIQSSNDSCCGHDIHNYSTNSSGHDGDSDGDGNFHETAVNRKVLPTFITRHSVVIQSQETTKEFLSSSSSPSSPTQRVNHINVAYSKMTGEPIGDNKQLEFNRPKCPHYVRNCSIISPCCGMVFGCRLCHDECEDQEMPFMNQIEFLSPRRKEGGKGDIDEGEETKKRKRLNKIEGWIEEETPNKTAAAAPQPTGGTNIQRESMKESGSRYWIDKTPTGQYLPCNAMAHTNRDRNIFSVASSSTSSDESNIPRKRSSLLNKNTRRSSTTSKKKNNNDYSRRFSMGSITANGGDDVHHNINRFDIKEIICRNCLTRQSSKTNNCINCNVQFGEYHCDICNIWIESKDEPYHCNKCGICRVGGGDNYKHCDSCGMCIDKTLFETHNCTAGKMMSNCPICFEDLFSSRTACHELPCNHTIHWKCYRELLTVDIRCPLCKKTIVEEKHRPELWSALREDIQAQPLPPDQTRVVDVTCVDCEFCESDRRWHPLGVQCSGCCSYNTSIVFKMVGQEAIEYFVALEETREGVDMLDVNSREG